jgi:hypothetical protein
VIPPKLKILGGFSYELMLKILKEKKYLISSDRKTFREVLKIKIIKNNETITVITDNKEWKVSINQCFTRDNEKVYKLDDDYILFESDGQYGLMKIIDKCED